MLSCCSDVCGIIDGLSVCWCDCVGKSPKGSYQVGLSAPSSETFAGASWQCNAQSIASAVQRARAAVLLRLQTLWSSLGGRGFFSGSLLIAQHSCRALTLRGPSAQAGHAQSSQKPSPRIRRSCCSHCCGASHSSKTSRATGYHVAAAATLQDLIGAAPAYG